VHKDEYTHATEAATTMTDENPTQRALDWPAAIELAGGSEDLARDLLRMLLEEAPRLLDGLDEQLTSGDPQRLWEDAHKLHGSTAYCGVPALRAASSALEAAIKAEDLGAVRTCLDDVRAALDDLATAAQDNPSP